ncbi:hypothetical protein DPMN_148175 [Dreissena polymorpha]|uniref:Mutator-like transposase domain-containing protein n=1 Tax=Dreissena polymorpha TaxID=45954 RepID=A0A9D4FBZ8_DREPO|nr:hypothetical protein DPMN_148175 [Dreissena polymorpha]
MKKRFDKNHVVINFTKSLYKLKSEKGMKISKATITHLEKCLKYAFSKNKGDATGIEENLKEIVPHQFGDHSLCQARFCGYKRNPTEKYIHRSLPYKTSLHDDSLRERLQDLFKPYTTHAHQYIDLGSSQQCEHANKEVSSY